MNMVARGALWGAVIFAATAVVGVFVVAVLSVHFDTGPPTIDGTFWVAAEAGAGAGLFGAGAGVITQAARKRNAPTVQYDAPQEGVWPPPPAVPIDEPHRD